MNKWRPSGACLETSEEVAEVAQNVGCLLHLEEPLVSLISQIFILSAF